MENYFGYTGKYLLINLSERTSDLYFPKPEDMKNYLGGKGLAAKILYDRLPPHTDAFSPENILIVNTGPYTGSNGPCSSRFNMTTKSPLSLGIGTSNCGGTFGIILKKAGFDGVIISGKSSSPVTIAIEDEKVSFQDASSLWGLDTFEVQRRLPKESGKLVIGPAGENLVRYACVLSEDRAFGRCGMGAVMGSKKIKAITVSGKNKINIFDQPGFKKICLKWTKTLKKHPITGNLLPKYGTANLVRNANKMKIFPTKNFLFGNFDNSESLSGETLTEKHLVKNTGCITCPIRCGREVKYKDQIIKGPEYETIGLLGSNILNPSLEKIIEWNFLLDKYGMDTISFGGSLSFVMELKEKGLLKADIEFGKTDNIAALIEDTAFRRGLGDDMAEGALRLSQKYGGEEYSIQSKGLELAAYEPRRSVGHGLGYATANRGGCHLNGGYLVFLENLGPIAINPTEKKGKPALVVLQQNLFDAISSMGTCLFSSYAVFPGHPHTLVYKYSFLAKIISSVILNSRFILNHIGRLKGWMLPFHLPDIPYTKMLTTLTGRRITIGRFLEIGANCYDIERLLNTREAIDSKFDTLPKRLTDDLQDANDKNTRVDLKYMLPIYYKIRRWDKSGVPRKNP